MPRTYRRHRSHSALWTAVLALTLVAGMMTVGSAAWADEPAQDDAPQPQQQSPAQPDPTVPGPITDPQPPSPTVPSPTVPPPTQSTTAVTQSTVAPVVRAIPLTVSPRAGGPGTTVSIRADLRGCTRPNSADGYFLDRLGEGVDGSSRGLVQEHVTGGRWYSALYSVTNRDAVGRGQFGVACDFNRPTATEGYASFRVEPSRAPVPIRITPQAGGRGTTVRITTDVGRCERLHIWFYDSKSEGVTEAGGAKRVTAQRVTDAGRFTASYTLTKRDAIGRARFTVVCGLDIDNARVGEASFRVLASNGQGSGGNDQTAGGNDQTAERNDDTQLPNRIDTGQGGTADDGGQGGPDPVVLLPAAGLLLIMLAAGLWLAQRRTRRRL